MRKGFYANMYSLRGVTKCRRSPEVNICGSDPRLYDSDNDGIGDGDEIALGKNPTDPSDASIRVEQTKVQEINNSEDPTITSIEVTMDLANTIDRSLSIRDMFNVDVYSTDVVGRLGSPISFQCEESFDSANVVIHYNEAALGDTLEENLGVLWYDEESGFYVIQDQAVVDTTNNTVTVELPHFSTYVLVDLDVWNSIEPVHYDVPDVERGVDYYVAFDISQNMTVQARRNAYSTFQSLVSNMEDEDRVIIFYFDTNYVIDDLYYAGDTAEMNAVLSRVYNNLMGASLGGDYGSLLLPFQITEALINQGVNDIGNARELLVFTNDTEQIHTTSNLNDMLYRKAAGGFTSDFIITENISNGQWNFAWQYAEETNSGYYKYPSCSSVVNSIANYRLVSGWSLDNDIDGIPNVVEEQGILATNGHKYYSDPRDRDPDGDGVSDLEEDGVIYVISRSADGRTLTIYLNGVVVFTSQYGSISSDSQYYLLESYSNFVQPGETTEVCILRSNPQMPDSDGDLDNDGVDPNPTTTLLNDQLIQNITALEDIATENNYSNPKETVIRFIRSFNSSYTSAKWDAVGGTIDTSYNSLIYNSHTELYNYFLRTDSYYADYSGNCGDLRHFAATLSAYYYATDFSNGTGIINSLAYQGTPERTINDQAGWAGDYQQTIVANILPSITIYSDYDSMHDFASSVFFSSGSAFPFDDLYADADAINIYELNNRRVSLSNSLCGYFQDHLNERFTLFSNNAKYSERTAMYSQERYMFQVWPLFEDDNDNSLVANITSDQWDAIRDAFIEKLNALKETE